MDHLRLLDSKRPISWSWPVIPTCQAIHTPLDLKEWILDLSSHPDTSFASYILKGIQEGFRIGFDRHSDLESASSNLHCDVPRKVTEYLRREVALHRMWKFPVGASPRGVHRSPLGLIPKKNKPGKWRLIVDLSSPEGSSINNGIDTDLSSLHYTSVDDLAALVVAEGKSSFIAKADIQEAYRMIPVHPDDQSLLGVSWNGAIYIDKVLSFGLRSAPKIFSAVADALLWSLNSKGTTKGLHYLDDFVLVSKDRHTAEKQNKYCFLHLSVSKFQ